MFAYNPFSSNYEPTPEQRRARHFAFHERRSLDWNRNSTLILVLSLFMGGCVKLLTLPPAGAGLTLLVSIGFMEDRPCIDTPFWMGRAALASIGAFYFVLGTGMGVYAVLCAVLLTLVHRRVFA